MRWPTQEINDRTPVSGHRLLTETPERRFNVTSSAFGASLPINFSSANPVSVSLSVVPHSLGTRLTLTCLSPYHEHFWYWNKCCNNYMRTVGWLNTLWYNFCMHNQESTHPATQQNHTATKHPFGVGKNTNLRGAFIGKTHLHVCWDVNSIILKPHIR